MLDDRYRVDALIGTGGMSRVYAARDLLLGRTVAIKIITATDDDLDAGQRVRAETAALAALTHPHLVVLHDARLTGPGPRYLVMERIDGPSLSARLAEGPMTDAEVTRIAGELADALSAVHAAGIVHRDVKPSNILLAPSTAPTGRRGRSSPTSASHTCSAPIASPSPAPSSAQRPTWLPRSRSGTRPPRHPTSTRSDSSSSRR